MRRDGVVTGYFWSRTPLGKVKVTAKPTNASKASGRCKRAKCPGCHDHPVSRAKSKTKGRNKRALSRVLVDDDWAFCGKRGPPGHAKAVLSTSSTYDVLDACRSDADHDVDDDACPADANPLGRELDHNELDAGGADGIDVAGDFSDGVMHAHDDDIKDVGMMMHAGLLPHNGDFTSHSCHVFSFDGKLSTAPYPIPAVVYAESFKKVVPIVNIGIYAMADNGFVAAPADDDADDDGANSEYHFTTAHVKNGVINDVEDGANVVSNANDESDAISAHATDDVTNDYDDDNDDDDDDGNDLYNNEDGDDIRSLISGLTDVKWPICGGNEVLEIESDADSLGGDWCYVANSSDAIDDWYLC